MSRERRRTSRWGARARRRTGWWLATVLTAVDLLVPVHVPERAYAMGPAVATSSIVSTRAVCTNRRRLHTWRTRRLAEQTLVVPVDENDVSAASSQVAAGAGGIILYGSRAPADLALRLGRLTSLAPHGIAPLVMTDEEGGTVQRMANLVGRVPPARHMGRFWTARRIRAVARRLAVRMRNAGVTMDLAPVLDLDARPGPDAADAIGSRSFSPRRAVTTRDGLAFARGLQAGGVVPAVKHFPGIGRADGNTDLALASTPPWRKLRTDDLQPFRSAVRAGLPAVMVSNALVPGLTRGPASLARAVVHRVLRRKLGFRGLVLPDSLTAGAVRTAGFSLPEAAVHAIEVGEDMILFNVGASELASTARRVVSAVVTAVRSGRLARARLESRVVHVLRVKKTNLCTVR